MGTTELIIVFSALMVLIALVTIGIDWIGKPLKNRRFIPRLYRFDDEKLPVDEYGRTDFTPAASSAAPLAGYAAPIGAGTAVSLAAQSMPHAQSPPVVVAELSASSQASTDLQPRTQPSRVAAAATHSAFSDTLANTDGRLGPQHGSVPFSSRPQANAATGDRAQHGWQPGMALDATIDDHKPDLAAKAERFWKATGQSIADDSHFDTGDRERMATGRAPTRTNPRTGRDETMRLTGLRQASRESDVRMRWPDESVDPWNSA